jgi:hypothetical protein
MDREKVKLIVRNMELLVQSLKSELEEQPDYNYEEIVSYIEDDIDEYYVEEEE